MAICFECINFGSPQCSFGFMNCGNLHQNHGLRILDDQPALYVKQIPPSKRELFLNVLLGYLPNIHHFIIILQRQNARLVHFAITK